MYRIIWKENQAAIIQLGVSKTFMLIEYKYKDGGNVYELLKRYSENSNDFVSIDCIGTLIKCLKIVEEAGEHMIIT